MAQDGIGISAVVVATTTHSISLGSICAASQARRAACAAMSLVVSPSRRTRRSRIPVRVRDPLVGSINALGDIVVRYQRIGHAVPRTYKTRPNHDAIPCML